MTRLFLVSPDRKQKYLPTEDALIPSRTLSIYVRTGGSNSTSITIRRTCSICVNGVWSGIDQDCTRKNLDIYYCSRDHLESTGYNRIELEPGRMLDDSVSYQNLFEPGQVKVVYKLSETVELCRICETWGEWSDYPTATFCHSHVAFFKANRSMMVGLRSSAAGQPSMRPCELKELERTESNEYIRENIQAPNANRYINDTEEIVEDSAMAVYKTNAHQADLTMLHMKYCRKCSDGSWDFNYVACPVEFAIKKCDPSRLRGVNYFVYASDGVKVSEKESMNLVWPGRILAVYEFGVQKYCKTCSEDGVWSSYPQYQLCNLVNWT